MEQKLCWGLEENGEGVQPTNTGLLVKKEKNV